MKKILTIFVVMALLGCASKVDYLNINDDFIRESIVNNFEAEFNDKFIVEDFKCRIAEEKNIGRIKFCDYILISEKFPGYPISGTKPSTDLNVTNLEKREYDQTSNTVQLNNIYKGEIEKILGTDIMIFVDPKSDTPSNSKCDSFWNKDCKVFTFYIALQVNNYEDTEKYMDSLNELDNLLKHHGDSIINNDLHVYFIEDFSQIEFLKHLVSGTGINKTPVYFGHVDFSNDGFDVIREVKSSDLIDQ
ncbi:MAG: hypothetical protein RR945_01665 [Erysipelotrichaceae bacterium]